MGILTSSALLNTIKIPVNGYDFFYDGSAAGLADKLTMLSERVEKDRLSAEDTGRVVRLMERYRWGNLGGVLDEAAEKVVSNQLSGQAPPLEA